LEGYVPSSEGDHVNTSGFRNVHDYGDTSYISIRYQVTLKRRSTYTTHFVLSPCIICSLLIPFIFLLPIEASAKILCGSVASQLMMYTLRNETNFFVGVGLLLANVLVFGEFESIVPHAYPRVPQKGM
jgi:hypothetical protein